MRDDDLLERRSNGRSDRGAVPPRRSEKAREAQDEVEQRRREVERRLERLRTSIGRETGMRPESRWSLVALAAGAAGFALGWKIGPRRRD